MGFLQRKSNPLLKTEAANVANGYPGHFRRACAKDALPKPRKEARRQFLDRLKTYRLAKKKARTLPNALCSS
jgi:hypothetical protein